MNPTRKRRLGLLLIVLAAVSIAGTLLIIALQHNVRYLLTPSDVASGQAHSDMTFRLGGVVCEGSLRRTPGTLDIRFVVTDRLHQVPVYYTGILPDLFREGQSVIATGQMGNRGFGAVEILAKHDENYEPKEVHDAMTAARARNLPRTPCSPPPP